MFRFEDDQERVFAQLDHQLKRVAQGLTFEFGPESDGRREFIISADGDKRFFPAVRRLAACAPHFQEWIIIPFRPPKDLQNYRSVRIDDIHLSVDDVWFSYVESDAKIDLEMFIRDLNAANREDLGAAAFLLLDIALGEYVVETRVGGIAWHPLPAEPHAEGLLPLERIVDVCERAGINELAKVRPARDRSGHPGPPYFAATHVWNRSSSTAP